MNESSESDEPDEVFAEQPLNQPIPIKASKFITVTVTAVVETKALDGWNDGGQEHGGLMHGSDRHADHRF
jgi:hypothetical protein